ncbi:YoaK family protein [Streptomyces anthocyanicus]|uniref:YoaK family protein n=1 Tax=Streptomyces anthocyanicus TaxID=68174 RepID=UPI003255493D
MTQPGLMLALTFATGVVDAVGYLRLDQVFAGNMTGNVVILGMAATGGGTGLPVLGPVVALASFLAGAATAGRVLRTAAPGWSSRCGALLGGVGLVLTATALGPALVGADTSGARAGMASSLALAMGAQAATARHLAVRDVTTVVVTSTLTGLAADSRLGAARGRGALRRTAAVALIVAGAAAGALLCQVHEGLAVAAAACVVLAVTALGSRAAPATTGAPSTAPPTAPATASSTAPSTASSTAPSTASSTAPSTASSTAPSTVLPRP